MNATETLTNSFGTFKLYFVGTETWDDDGRERQTWIFDMTGPWDSGTFSATSYFDGIAAFKRRAAAGM
jgi:hypothetical protein